MANKHWTNANLTFDFFLFPFKSIFCEIDISKIFSNTSKNILRVRFRDTMQTLLNSGDHCITTAIFSPMQHLISMLDTDKYPQMPGWMGKHFQHERCVLEHCHDLLALSLVDIFLNFFIKLSQYSAVAKCYCHWSPPSNRSLNYMPVGVEK